MSVLAAYILVPLVYVLVFKEKSLRHCRLQCFLALSVRQALILTNLYVARLPGYAGDANGFYRNASTGINWGRLVGTGAEFYSNFLASIFSIAGPSREIAFESSFLAFGLLLIVIGRFTRLFGYSEKTGVAVLLVGLSPSAACYTSSILREGWQELFLLTACYFTVKLRQKFSVKSQLALGGSLVLLGCLQKGLALYALLFAMLAFLYLTHRGKARGPMLVFAFVVIFFGGYFKLLGAGDLELETSSAVVEAFTEGEIVEFALEYRGGLNEARANYAEHLELDTISGLLWAFPQLVFYYWFCPLPWQVEESVDMIAMGEIWVRAFLLFLGFLGFRRAAREERTALGFLWMAFFILEVMFAAGTANWGTAARHRTVGLPLFCVLSVSGLVQQRGTFGVPGEDGASSVKSKPLSRREQVRRLRRRARESHQ